MSKGPGNISMMGPDKADPNGRLADNIVYFARALRKSGMRLGPASVAEAVDAVLTAGIGSRDDFYWTLHSVLVTRHEDSVVFDEAFRLFWRSRELVEKMLAMFSPKAPPRENQKKKRAGEDRVADAMFEGHRREAEKEPPPIVEVDAKLSVSEREVLREKDFAHMSAAEIAEAKRAIRTMVIADDRKRTRRRRAAVSGSRIDPRATLRSAARGGGDVIMPKFTRPKEIYPPLVVLADISGSMSQYSRIFLHFIHALAENRTTVHAFLFGTRLTNITRQMRHRDIDEALDDCATSVDDWSGGTRIGETLEVFNKRWSRRVLGQGATVLMITDGLERDDVALLDGQMERLHKSCRRLIWLNPLLRYDGFEARARGVRTMLGHVDEFRPVHSLDKLQDLCQALAGVQSGRRNNDPRRWLAATRLEAA